MCVISCLLFISVPLQVVSTCEERQRECSQLTYVRVSVCVCVCVCVGACMFDVSLQALPLPTSWMEGAALKIFLAFVTIFKPAPYTYVGSVRALTFKKISTSNFSVSFFVFVFVIFFSSHTLYFHYFFVSVILVIYQSKTHLQIFFYLEANKFFPTFSLTSILKIQWVV